MGSGGDKRAGDLTLSGGGRRRRRRFALTAGVWLVVLVFVLAVLAVGWI